MYSIHSATTGPSLDCLRLARLKIFRPPLVSVVISQVLGLRKEDLLSWMSFCDPGYSLASVFLYPGHGLVPRSNLAIISNI